VLRSARCLIVSTVSFGPVLHPGLDRINANENVDSAIVDVPMTKVKFNVSTEYAYLQNFKILQSGLYLSVGAEPRDAYALGTCKITGSMP
jgi:hypothetical protein